MKKILLGLIGLLFAIPGWATDLPAGYTELQYIESTGTQWIDPDINITPTNIATFKSEAVISNVTREGGSISGYSSPSSKLWYGLTSLSPYEFYYSDGHKEKSLNVVSEFRYYKFVIDAPNSSYSVYTESDEAVTSKTGLSFSTPNDFKFYLFTFNPASGDASAFKPQKIKYAKFWFDGALVRDMVPAKNSSGVIGMYDVVSGQFFTNAGTGEFIAGPEVSIRIATTAYNTARFSPVVTELNDTIATIRDVVTNTINQTKAIADLQATKQTRPDETCPAGKKCLLVEDDAGQPHWYEIIENAYSLPNGYTELQYIESTGTQYIDTGIVPANKKIGMEAKFQFTSLSPATATIIGSGVTDNTDNCRLWGLYNGRYRIKLGNTGMSYGTPDTNIHTVIVNMSDGGAWLDGQKIWTNPQQTIPTSNNKNLNIFTDNGGGGTFSSAKIYYIKLYDNDVLIADYIPARNSANKIGFYDTVSGRFFTNAGTGTFVAGPAVQ